MPLTSQNQEGSVLSSRAPSAMAEAAQVSPALWIGNQPWHPGMIRAVAPAAGLSDSNPIARLFV